MIPILLLQAANPPETKKLHCGEVRSAHADYPWHREERLLRRRAQRGKMLHDAETSQPCYLADSIYSSSVRVSEMLNLRCCENQKDFNSYPAYL